MKHAMLLVRACCLMSLTVLLASAQTPPGAAPTAAGARSKGKGKQPTSSEKGAPKMEKTSTSAWYEWAFPLDDPALENIDLSYLLDPPAGKHGFLACGKDGHFYFEDGTRARFFGTSVGGNSCMPDKKMAEIMSARLAKYGINMVRLHAIDTVWAGLIDRKAETSRDFVPDALDKYDYFVAQLKKNGIYVYFDLLDYRQFKEGDGIKDAAHIETRWSNSLKGASIFDPRMIELQKEYATKLLTHKNPYTGLRYVDEPALAVQEITNENSLFYIQQKGLMLPAYWEDLRLLWNQWLVKRYGGRDALAKAWTNSKGECALRPDEDPLKNNLPLPAQSLYADTRNEPYAGEKSPARLNALTRFLYETEIAYYDEVIKHLRGIGLKCPITGTNQDFSDASNLANARCDFITRNNYWCHPNVNVTPLRFADNAMVKSSIARQANPVSNIASSAVEGKPIIVPEFNFPWPNEWRAECLPMMAAYARLQDWDGILYFSYHPARTELGNFNNQSDPVRWGQVPLAALIFLRGDVAVARNTIDIGVSRTDAFAARPQRTNDRYSPYRILPFISKVRNAYFETVYDGAADVAVASGHSAGGDYSKAKRAIVFADSPFYDENASEADGGRSARETFPGLKTRPGAGGYDTEVDPETLPKGALTITRDGRPVGFLDDKLCVYPCASADENSRDADGEAWLHRLYLEAVNRWKIPGAAPLEEAGAIFRSDTGQLALDCKRGMFTINAPNVSGAVGFFAATPSVELDSLTIKCKTPFASISVVSLDGKAVNESERLLVTAVARAENTGQGFEKVDAKGAAVAVDADTGLALKSGQYALAAPGKAPVIAEPVDAVISIVNNQRLRAFALSPTGEKRNSITLTPDGKRQILETKSARSPWILLSSE